MKLDGFNLDSRQAAELVLKREPLSLAAEALDRMAASRRLVLDLIDSPQLVYGLNTGLGKNKDQRISREEIAAFNEQLIYAHCVGLEPYFPLILSGSPC